MDIEVQTILEHFRVLQNSSRRELYVLPSFIEHR